MCFRSALIAAGTWPAVRHRRGAIPSDRVEPCRGSFRSRPAFSHAGGDGLSTRGAFGSSALDAVVARWHPATPGRRPSSKIGLKVDAIYCGWGRALRARRRLRRPGIPIGRDDNRVEPIGGRVVWSSSGQFVGHVGFRSRSATRSLSRSREADLAAHCDQAKRSHLSVPITERRWAAGSREPFGPSASRCGLP
jgi:hypothetical protein